ncbi:hypothetical protein GCM10023160_28490 [Brachybacterium paraconglomeratum]
MLMLRIVSSGEISSHDVDHRLPCVCRATQGWPWSRLRRVAPHTQTGRAWWFRTDTGGAARTQLRLRAGTGQACTGSPVSTAAR